MSDSPLSTPLATERGDVELSAEEEARLDADPLQRLYDMNKIEAPAMLATVLGCFTKLVMLQDRGDDIAEYAQEFFERLKLARAADPKIDFDRFLSTQLKIMEKQIENSTYDLSADFNPPESLAPLLTAFSAEVIRYQPSGENHLFSFALEYFTCLSEDGSPNEFLRKQARLAEEKQKAYDLENKRTQMAKEKQKKKVAMN